MVLLCQICLLAASCEPREGKALSGTFCLRPPLRYCTAETDKGRKKLAFSHSQRKPPIMRVTIRSHNHPKGCNQTQPPWRPGIARTKATDAVAARSGHQRQPGDLQLPVTFHQWAKNATQPGPDLSVVWWAQQSACSSVPGSVQERLALQLARRARAPAAPASQTEEPRVCPEAPEGRQKTPEGSFERQFLQKLPVLQVIQREHRVGERAECDTQGADHSCVRGADAQSDASLEVAGRVEHNDRAVLEEKLQRVGQW
uniref:Putative secreted protein n=1 Tax=Ixodes ricinus TaxID=34613 RepID=A0A147BE16_IXORI